MLRPAGWALPRHDPHREAGPSSRLSPPARLQAPGPAPPSPGPGSPPGSPATASLACPVFTGFSRPRTPPQPARYQHPTLFLPKAPREHGRTHPRTPGPACRPGAQPGARQGGPPLPPPLSGPPPPPLPSHQRGLPGRAAPRPEGPGSQSGSRSLPPALPPVPGTGGTTPHSAGPLGVPPTPALAEKPHCSPPRDPSPTPARAAEPPAGPAAHEPREHTAAGRRLALPPPPGPSGQRAAALPAPVPTGPGSVPHPSLPAPKAACGAVQWAHLPTGPGFKQNGREVQLPHAAPATHSSQGATASASQDRGDHGRETGGPGWAAGAPTPAG